MFSFKFHGRLTPFERIDEEIILAQGILRRMSEVIAVLPSLE
jgi:hypothetical protein